MKIKLTVSRHGRVQEPEEFDSLRSALVQVRGHIDADNSGPKRIEWVLYNIIAVRAPKRPGAVQERLDAFMTTPAGQAMPEEHRARLRDLGYTVGPKS